MNPVIYNCPKGVWVLVSEMMRGGMIHILNISHRYVFTYRDWGDTAPTDDEEGVPIPDKAVSFEFAQVIDFYVKCKDNDGKVVFHDGASGNFSAGRTSQDVSIQDQTTQPLDLFFQESLGVTTTLSVNASVDDISVTVTDPTDFVIGDIIGIFSGVSQENRFYFGEVLNVVGSVISLDTPLDFAFVIGDLALPLSSDLNVLASQAAPRPFIIRGPATGFAVDIVRIIFKIITVNPPEFSDFGDIAGGLLNGCFLRISNGVQQNIFNIKTNGEIANLMYDVTFYDQTKQQGVNGIVARMTFGGQSKHGVVIRLEPGETLEFVIQDNLLSLLSFKLIAQGHIVEP